ncbi:MAG: nucleotidyltransferase domain-containing protein [Candidatus Omnitrophota bacterium]
MSKNKYLEELKNLALEILKDEKVKIILFGSRARGDNNIISDVDIGLVPYGQLAKNKVIILKEKIEDLNIPYKVELVNFSEVSEDFKKEALKGAVVWKE